MSLQALVPAYIFSDDPCQPLPSGHVHSCQWGMLHLPATPGTVCQDYLANVLPLIQQQVQPAEAAQNLSLL